MNERRYYARNRAGKKQVVDRGIGCVIADCTFQESAVLIVRALNAFQASGQAAIEKPARKRRGSKTGSAASPASAASAASPAAADPATVAEGNEP